MSGATWRIRVPCRNPAVSLLERGATGLSVDLDADATVASVRETMSQVPWDRVPLWINGGLAGPVLLEAAFPECARGTGWWELDAAQPLVAFPILHAAWSRTAPGLARVSLHVSSLREQAVPGALELACLCEAAIETPAAAIGLTISVRLLEEIARLRLARRLFPGWPIHGRSLARELTAEQRDVNLVRVTYQALAAALVGLDSFHALSRDHCLAEEDFDSLLLALRTQQVLAAESRLESGKDPLAGSALAEDIGPGLEQDVAAFRARIQAAGGWGAAIRTDLVSRLARDHAVERPRIGVDRFVMEELGLQRSPSPPVRPLPVPELVRAHDGELFDAIASAAREGLSLGRLNASLAAR
jgi:hypothetical protein